MLAGLAFVLLVGGQGQPPEEARAPSAHFKLSVREQAPPAQGHAAQLPPGLPPDVQLVIAAFAPSVPARCSWVGPADDVSVRSGGIELQSREPHRAARLAADLAAEDRAATALVLAVAAQVAERHADASRWREVAHEHHGQRLMQVLVVSGYSLSQAQRHEDAILLHALALQIDPAHPAAQDALEFLGVSLQYANHLGCAEAAHARALARSHNRALPHLNLGLLKLHSHREADAPPHLEKAIALCCGQDDSALQPLCAPALQVSSSMR
jgi:tetratricopeptide (TPR) repeat protein